MNRREFIGATGKVVAGVGALLALPAKKALAKTPKAKSDGQAHLVGDPQSVDCAYGDVILKSITETRESGVRNIEIEAVFHDFSYEAPLHVINLSDNMEIEQPKLSDFRPEYAGALRWVYPDINPDKILLQSFHVANIAEPHDFFDEAISQERFHGKHIYNEVVLEFLI